MRRFAALVAAVVLLLLTAMAQEHQTPFTLKTNTRLVVQTVFVRDAQNNPIEGLKREDFNVTEDGTPQTISVFEFQDLNEVRATSTGTHSAGQAEPREATNLIRLDQESSSRVHYTNRRLIAFYFDFAAISNTDRMRTLGAARDFIDNRMTAADLVAILAYSGGSVRLLSDFSDDRQQLLASIADLDTDNPQGRIGVDPAFGQNEGEFDIFRTDRRLMALLTATRMLGHLTQAKCLIYFTDGSGLNVGNQAQLRATLNEAIRFNVSIFPIDARGLPAFAPMGNASQRSPGGIGMYTGASAMSSMRLFQQSQDVLYTLARNTRGKALLDSNDLTLGIVAAQRAMASYYILGYYPTNTALDGRLRRVRITLNARSATLSYREAYFANKPFEKFTEEDKERQLEDALLSEDPITELTTAIELHHFRTQPGEYFVSLTMQIPGSEIAASAQLGASRAHLDFIGEVRDESGATVTNLRDKAEIRLSKDVLERLSSSPVQYDAGFTLAPGEYVIKVLARNADTGKIGTYQTAFVVPDLDKEETRLPISSVVLSSQRASLGDALYGVGKGHLEGRLANPLIENRQKLVPSLARRFSRTRPLHVYLQAYPRSSHASISAFVSFYRDREKVFETAVPVTATPVSKPQIVPLRLTAQLEALSPGIYTLQVTVLDRSDQKAAFWQTPILLGH